eukprot:9471482-Pyramimonas_sp.AAC.2
MANHVPEWRRNGAQMYRRGGNRATPVWLGHARRNLNGAATRSPAQAQSTTLRAHVPTAELQRLGATLGWPPAVAHARTSAHAKRTLTTCGGARERPARPARYTRNRDCGPECNAAFTNRAWAREGSNATASAR